MSDSETHKEEAKELKEELEQERYGRKRCWWCTEWIGDMWIEWETMDGHKAPFHRHCKIEMLKEKKGDSHKRT